MDPREFDRLFALPLQAAAKKIPAEVGMHPQTLAVLRLSFPTATPQAHDPKALLVGILVRADPTIALGWLHWHAADGTFLEATPSRTASRREKN